MASLALTQMVTYKGFVYVKQKEGERAPGLSQVKSASVLLNKPKKAQQVHPLFACGFDTKLKMTVSEDGILVTVPTDDEEVLVMDHPVYKVAYVINMGKDVYFVAKHTLRGKKGGIMFKCHGFKADSSDAAQKLASHISGVTNRVFKQLRRTREFIQKRRNVVRKGRKGSTNGSPLKQVSNGKDANAQQPSPQVAENGVQLRRQSTRRAVDDDDDEAETVLLRELMAQARASVLSGQAIDSFTGEPSDEDIRAIGVALGEDGLEASSEEQAKQQEEFNRVRDQLWKAILGSDDSFSDVDEPEPKPETETVYFDGEFFEDFSDEFARMSLCLAGKGTVRSPANMPALGDITLDSEYFEVAGVEDDDTAA